MALTREEINKKIAAGVSKLDENAIQKLQQGYAIGATDAEMAVYLDVWPQTITNWRKKHAKLFEYLDGLKARPILQAREEVVKGFKGNPELALKFLERKVKDEFSLRQENINENTHKFRKIKVVVHDGDGNNIDDGYNSSLSEDSENGETEEANNT